MEIWDIVAVNTMWGIKYQESQAAMNDWIMSTQDGRRENVREKSCDILTIKPLGIV